MELGQIKSLSERIKNNIAKVIVGKDDIVDLMLVSLFCSGHVLLEDYPGMGKTMLAKCLSKSIDCDFKRVQFTPDLLPSDLTGINYYNQKQGEFVFRAGPIFTNIVLADEINRATPRTQASLLECMEERQVTIDGETKKLSDPFFVIATQNPVETQGTFPLPEAQMDRFLMRLKTGYPSASEGRAILDRFQNDSPFKEIECVAKASEIVDARRTFTKVRISDDIKDYIINIVESTRKHDKILLGISPRGSLALMRAVQALAVIRGRDFVTPDDVKHVSVPVLAHRLVLRGHSITTGIASSETVIQDILRRVPVPVEELR
ncbi:MAG: MoxR family ATPase [Clostridia bacterium]|nr:MoxR family ATPase [Clostridia bacterium]